MSSTQPPPELSQSYIEEYCGDKLMTVAIALIVLNTIFVALRCYSRYLQKASIGWDDILILPAYLSCLGLCITTLLSLKLGGIGHHFDVVVQFSPEKIKYWGRICLIAVPIFYAVCSALPKLVILAVYLRVFVHNWSRMGCYATGAVLIAACIANVILSIWQCSPTDYVWNKTIANGYCRDDIQAHIRWGQFPNIVTDVAMLVLPLPVVWNLHISRKMKVGLMATFAVGSIGLITATIRFAEFLATAAFADPTWKSVKLEVWACIETGVYLIAACLLACRPLLHKTLHADLVTKARSHMNNKSNKSYSHLSRGPLTSRDIEFQASPKRKPDRAFRCLDDDLETLTAGAKGSGISVQISAQRDVDPLRRLPVEMDRIHVRHEVALRSDERSTST